MPSLKIELPIGLYVEDGSTVRFLPKVLKPISKNFDIGFSYISFKTNCNCDPETIKLRYNVATLDLRGNLSNTHRKVNPHFSYLLSFATGKLIAVNNSIVGLDAALKENISKGKIVHGFNLGFDFRLTHNVSLTTQFQMLSVKKEVFIDDIEYHYLNPSDVDVPNEPIFDEMEYRFQGYVIGGIIVKLFSKKSFLR